MTIGGGKRVSGRARKAVDHSLHRFRMMESILVIQVRGTL